MAEHPAAILVRWTGRLAGWLFPKHPQTQDDFIGIPHASERCDDRPRELAARLRGEPTEFAVFLRWKHE